MIEITHPTQWLPQRLQKYTDPQTGITVEGGTADDLYRNLLKERLGQGYQTNPQKIRQEIIDWVCNAVPQKCQQAEDVKQSDVIHSKKLTVKDVRAFLASVKEDVKRGLVRLEEANKRAHVCISCPYNREIQGCRGCSGIANAVYKVLGHKRVNKQDKLRNCGVCGCDLASKVWVSKEGLKASAQIQGNAEDYPSWCWVPGEIKQG
jgi:hypothetical protein